MDYTNLFTERLNDSLLTEAFSASSMSKVFDLIGRYLSKTFASPAKWMKSDETNVITVNGQKLYTVSYFFTSGAELRLGFKTIVAGSLSISRLDYWKPGFTPKQFTSTGISIADYSITFDTDLSVMQIFPKVLPALKSILTTKSGAKTYEILITPKGAESLTEAQNFSGSKSQIVRDMLKAGMTKADIYAKIGDDASAKSLVSKIGKELGIVVTAKVTPAGNRTEKPSPSASAAIKKGYKLIPKYSDIATVYEDLNHLLDAVILKKKFNALLITGSTGTGKTQNVMNFLKEHGLQSSDTAKGEGEADYMIIKGGAVSGFALFQNMFELRDAGKLILLDDADSAFDDSSKNNLLKAALDSYDERFISWETKNPNVFKVNGKIPIEDGDDVWEANVAQGKFPNRFAYTGQMIIISNKHISEFDAAVRGRCVSVDITIKSEDMLNRIDTLINSGSTFSGANKATMEKAMKFMKGLPGNNKKPGEYWPGTTYGKEDYILVKEDERDVNFRTFMTVVKFADLGFPDTTWQRLAMKYAGIPQELLTGSTEEKPAE